MKEKAARLREIVAQYDKNRVETEPDLFFDFFVNPEIHARLIMGPIDVADGISHLLAERIAKKNGVSLTQYDFSKDRWSEPRDYRPVFSLDLPDDEREFESSAQKLRKASKELKDSSERIVEMLGHES